jgi:hypothetical protein
MNSGKSFISVSAFRFLFSALTLENHLRQCLRIRVRNAQRDALQYLFLNRSQYSRSLGVNTRRKNTSPWRSIAAFTRPTSAISTPSPTIKLPPSLSQLPNLKSVDPATTETAKAGNPIA